MFLATTWMSSILIGMDASPEELLADWAAMRLTIFERASHQGRGGRLPRVCLERSSLSTVIKSTRFFGYERSYIPNVQTFHSQCPSEGVGQKFCSWPVVV